LRLRAVVRIDDEQHAVDHFHDALDLAAKIGVAGGVDDIDVVVLPLEGGVLGADGDALSRSRSIESITRSSIC